MPLASTSNSKILDFSDGKATMLNNKDWLLDLNFVEFLRDVGSEFLVNEMIKKMPTRTGWQQVD